MYAGTGVYALGEAARLIGVSSRQLSRWLFGHHYSNGRDDGRSRGWSAPLWTPQLAEEPFDEKVIGFHDLLEVRFVDAFVSFGVPLSVVRRCLLSAQQIYGVKYPFTTLRFKTDGRTVFGEAVRQAEKEGVLVDLKDRQNVFGSIISPSLYAGIEYQEKTAARWYPVPRHDDIVLDPTRQFGRPILDSVGVPTATVLASFMAEGEDEQAVKQTAAIYDLPVKLVKAAVRFEQSLGQRTH